MNAQQLSKHNKETNYVRGYYLADDKDQLIVSLDWSAVELVLIGECSGDLNFAEAYGQRPHKDLHGPAAARALGMSMEEYNAHPDKKMYRSKVGKPSNFGYWYSGWLATTAKEMGWDMNQTAEAVRAYAEGFPIGEEWRLNTIALVKKQGFVQLPDGHRRVRFEATQNWEAQFLEAFEALGGGDAYLEFARRAMAQIQRRAGNQAVNAMIQGSCGSLAKRAILSMKAKIKEKGLRARFMLLIHDEVLFSVHKDDCLATMDLLYDEMIQGRGIVNNLVLDSSIAIGYTFQPYDANRAPYGQIELMELPEGIEGIAPERVGCRATQEERALVIKHLTNRPSTMV